MRRFAGLLAACILPAAAPAATVDQVLARLEKTEREMTSVKFDFSQNVQLSVSKQGLQTRGRAQFKRPDKFRVEIKAQDPQVFISDGATLWVHMPARKQALKQSMASWAQSAGFPEGLAPFRLSVKQMKAKYDFSVENPAAAQPVLKLKPKSEKSGYEMRLWVDMDKGLPAKTELTSPSATVLTQISGAELNPSVSDALFTFSPPEGTDVLQMPFGEK